MGPLVGSVYVFIYVFSGIIIKEKTSFSIQSKSLEQNETSIVQKMWRNMATVPLFIHCWNAQIKSTFEINQDARAISLFSPFIQKPQNHYG